MAWNMVRPNAIFLKLPDDELPEKKFGLHRGSVL